MDERGLYERFCLEGFQSGLSWLTILRKRESFRAAFAGFDPERVAEFGEADVERLLADAGIVRHRGKIEAAIGNARATLASRETTPLPELVWAYRVDGPAPASRRRLAVVHRRLEGALQGAPARGLPLRRADDRLRRDAGVRRRERPRPARRIAGRRVGASGIATAAPLRRRIRSRGLPLRSAPEL